MDVNEVALGAEAFADVDPFMQVSTMLTFLYIARRGLCNQKDIELELRVSNAVASRKVAFWRDFKKFNKEGIGYVESTEDPRDRRSKLLRLTPEGKKFYEQLRSKRHAQIAGKQLVS